MEVDVPVIAVAIAALPAVALLLAFAARMESKLFGSALDDGDVRDRYLGTYEAAAPGEGPVVSDEVALS
jgi:hypothetical protein